MARTSSYDVQALEAQIGPRATTPISSDNRALVQNWLVAQGLPSALVKSMRLETLQKAYASGAYTATLIKNHAEGGEAAAEGFALEAPQPVAPRATGKKADKLAALLAALGDDSDGGLDEDAVIALIRKHAPEAIQLPTMRVEIKTGGETKTIEGATHKQFAEVLRAAQAGPVCLVGPAGSGKTTLCEQVAAALGKPFYMNGAVSSEYKLTGYRDANGNLVRTVFRDAFENGGVYCMDEVDASVPAAILTINAALANGYMDFPDGMIKRHPDFQAIACANTYGMGADRLYVGRNQLDAATLDRFLFIDFGYDEVLERSLAGNDRWVERVQAIRRSVATLKVRHVVSPRASIMGAKLLALGSTQAEAERLAVWKGLDRETIAKIEAGAR